METETISKNEACPKSHMSRENLISVKRGMKKNGFFLFVVICAVSLVFSSCSTAKIFSSPDAKSLSMQHKKIAIVPPTIAIAAQKNIDAQSMVLQQKTESQNFQQEMYSWLLKRKMKGNFLSEIQDINTTNALLQKAGFPDKTFTTNELCGILNVDGILTSNYSLSKPMSTGAAIVVGVLFGAFGPTNSVTTSLTISDCIQGKMIWNYNDKLSGSLGSTPASIVDVVMNSASKKMPYYVKR